MRSLPEHHPAVHPVIGSTAAPVEGKCRAPAGSARGVRPFSFQGAGYDGTCACDQGISAMRPRVSRTPPASVVSRTR